MSVRDLIWVSVCQRIRKKQEIELAVDKLKAEQKTTEAVLLNMADVLAVALDSNYYCRFAALKESQDAMKHMKPYDTDDLPSQRHAFSLLPPEEQERRKIEKFYRGGKYVPS